MAINQDTLSPWSTPESTLPRVSIVDCSTPCTENALRELRKTLGIDTSSKLQGSFSFGSNGIQRTRLGSFILLVWMTALTIALLWWWLDGERQTILSPYNINLSSGPPVLDGLQFIDADHPYIRYVGRWTSTPDKTRKDGSFPGIYLDFALNGTNTILISLHNTDLSASPSISKDSPTRAFLLAANGSFAEPISLLARIDDDEYIILPNASSIVLVQKGNLECHARHEVRIIAPMIGGEVVETLQVEGIWIDEAGQLLPFEPSPTVKPPKTDNTELARPEPHRKMLEIVTDLPGSMAGRERKKGSSRSAILGGVLGWEYLLGEMFGVDHVTIGMDGMCLIQDCVGGTGSPAGLADIFFQSGPLGSAQYSQPWLFEGYVPEVMVLNIGNADWESFQMHNEEYNKTLWELSMLFEDTYVSLIRAIRTLAYPKYTSSVIDSLQSIAGGLPIFVMRPFRGQLEQVTHSVVDRLRNEGDSSVFWLDTSGWLNTDIDFDGPAEDQDFFLDGDLEESSSKQWRLTERGNQRIAILLHLHICRYLAKDVEKCALLPPEAYQGTIDFEGSDFNDLLEDDDD